MSYALLIDRLVPAHLRIDCSGRPVPVGARTRHGVAMGRRDRGAPGYYHRLHRRAVVHRDARRSALDPRPRLVSVPGPPPMTGLDPTFQLIGGGAQGSVGGTITWIIGVIGCVAIIGLLVNGRRQRRRYGFPLRPMWAEVLLGVLGCGASLGLAFYANNYFWPEGLRTWIAIEQDWGPSASGRLEDPGGLPVPDRPAHRGDARDELQIANRRRFGRYVYATAATPTPPVRRHQHPLHHPQDLRRDGGPARARRGDRVGPG